MGDELAAANVNRSYSLAATSIAIFTFLLFFMYPKFASVSRVQRPERHFGLPLHNA
jgi:hypothetical protein